MCAWYGYLSRWIRSARLGSLHLAPEDRQVSSPWSTGFASLRLASSDAGRTLVSVAFDIFYGHAPLQALEQLPNHENG